MNKEGRKFWFLAILLLLVIWSCYPLTLKIQDGSSRSGEGVEQVSEAPLPGPGVEDHAVEDELDLYALPFEELLEIQVASVM
ncbi:MAG: hypothetical protein GY869_32910 [Planctomycetes bacterium]|nr:hypothetical protein [Planctomycetota bacterium]